MKKSLAGITLVCIVFSLLLVVSPNVKGLADTANQNIGIQTLPYGNATLANQSSPPNIGGSKNIQPSTLSNAVLSPPSENITLTQPPISTPKLIQGADGSLTVDNSSQSASLPAGQTEWWSIDVWSTSSGGQMPSYMSGTFGAVSNTIGNLNANNGDCIIYEPINVAYGTSSSNYVWFQFVVYFFANGGSPAWSIWDFPNGANGASNTIPSADYIPGHSYNFAVTESNNYVTFSIQDVTSNTWSWSWGMAVPGGNIIYWTPQGAYSPASCVEGYTTNNQVTNVPYFETYIGTGETTHFHSNSAGIPSGIGTNIWTAGANYYYWAMLSQCSASGIIGTTNYGAGSVSNANNLVGSQDGQYAYIYGGNYGDGGNINAQMNTASGGNIYVYGYSTSGYYSNLYVYVSMDDSNWNQIGSYVTVSSSTPSWINIGSYMGDFKYIAVAGYDSYDSVALHLDAVKVGT